MDEVNRAPADPAHRATANDVIVALVTTGDAFLGFLNGALRHHQLSATGRQTLAVLDGADAPLTPTEIAHRLIVSTATVTSVLDTLERRDLVERRADEHDRRRLRIVITEAGSDLVASFIPEVVALQEAVMAGIGDAERRRLLAALINVHQAIGTVDVGVVLGNSDPLPKP